MRALVVALLALGACSDPPTVPPDAEVIPSALPLYLSQTGLYADIRTKTLSSRSVEFTPANVLWSDAAEKHRWVQLPAGAVIDSSDMNHWRFPIGTKFFKEFARDGKRLETRVVWRIADTGNRERDTLVGSYVWDDAESDAVFTPAGVVDVKGTDHDVPSAETCWRCHNGDAGSVLGFSALQLGDVSNWPLSNPPVDSTPFVAPNAALGYLHANCGHCHNPRGGAWVDSRMVLRLDVEEHDVASTQIYQSTVGVPLEQWTTHGYDFRIVAGDLAQSAIYYRMSQRTVNMQMPPIATEHVDDAGLALVRTWIESL